MDGGVYDNPEVSIAEATEDILNDEGITIENIRETDYEQLEQDIEEAEYIVKVDFYVAECSEFPSLGEYHEGLTLDEAIKIYEKIPEEMKIEILLLKGPDHGGNAAGHTGFFGDHQLKDNVSSSCPSSE